MRPPPAQGAAVPAGWRPLRRGFRAPARRPARASWSRRLRIATATATALTAALALLSCLAIAWRAPRPAAHPGHGVAGTAILGTATCSDWQRASDARRLALIGALGIAATQPDPENPGATLDQGAAYGILQRACSTHLSRSFLLYEIYNRAASFQPSRAGSSAISSSFGSR
jgi:hypothetical protein